MDTTPGVTNEFSATSTPADPDIINSNVTKSQNVFELTPELWLLKKNQPKCVFKRKVSFEETEDILENPLKYEKITDLSFNSVDENLSSCYFESGQRVKSPFVYNQTNSNSSDNHYTKSACIHKENLSPIYENRRNETIVNYDKRKYIRPKKHIHPYQSIEDRHKQTNWNGNVSFNASNNLSYQYDNIKALSSDSGIDSKSEIINDTGTFTSDSGIGTDKSLTFNLSNEDKSNKNTDTTNHNHDFKSSKSILSKSQNIKRGRFRKYKSLNDSFINFSKSTVGTPQKLGTPEKWQLLYPEIVKRDAKGQITKPKQRNLFFENDIKNKVNKSDSIYIRKSMKLVHSSPPKIDFFRKFLAETSNSEIINSILECLPPEDLVNVYGVCTLSRNVILRNNVLNSKRLDYLRNRKHFKENIFKSKTKNYTLEQKRKLYKENSKCITASRSSELMNVTNTKYDSYGLSNNQRSPPVSPSKRSFLNFQKEAKNLPAGQKLMKCIMCLYPAKIDKLELQEGKRVIEIAVCLKNICQYIFCKNCCLNCCSSVSLYNFYKNSNSENKRPVPNFFECIPKTPTKACSTTNRKNLCDISNSVDSPTDQNSLYYLTEEKHDNVVIEFDKLNINNVNIRQKKYLQSRKHAPRRLFCSIDETENSSSKFLDSYWTSLDKNKDANSDPDSPPRVNTVNSKPKTLKASLRRLRL